MKRSTEDVEDASSSGIGTWESLTREKKKRKYINVYLGDFYGNTDFGTIIDEDSHWKVDGINVTHVLRKFRQVSVEEAQMRKYLSNSRILSLSYIFLFSSIDRCAISKMAPRDQLLIMKSINEEEEYTLVDGEVINACREIQLIAANQKLTKDEAEDAIARLKTNSNNKDIKLASNIVSDCLFRFLNNTTSNNHNQGEAAMIIDKIKPYLLHSLISKIDFIKHDW